LKRQFSEFSADAEDLTVTMTIGARGESRAISQRSRLACAVRQTVRAWCWRVVETLHGARTRARATTGRRVDREGPRDAAAMSGAAEGRPTRERAKPELCVLPDLRAARSRSARPTSRRARPPPGRAHFRVAFAPFAPSTPVHALARASRVL
jgi:hypothetical protein